MAPLAKEPFTEAEVNRRFESALEQASVSLPALHGALDKMGAPKRNGETAVSLGLRFEWLVRQQASLKDQRVQIGCNFHRQPTWKWLLGVPLIYIPILVTVLPLIVAVLLVRGHLTLVGGHNLKSYWNDFAPSWASHRYTRKSQIVSNGLVERFGLIGYLGRSKLFWIFNCKLYCPLSVALIGYCYYLVQVVEQWWCPFGHDQKCNYCAAPIDSSMWHAAGDAKLMHPDDRTNPSWAGDR